MGYANPLFDLPASRQLHALPKEKRLALAEVFRELRAQANDKADAGWIARDDMAGGWRAISTYARHLAHLLEQKESLPEGVDPLPVVPAYAGPSPVYNPMPLELRRFFDLPSAGKLRLLPPDVKAALADLLDDLRVVAYTKAETAWETRKGPMAAYWRIVEDNVVYLAQKLRPAVIHPEFNIGEPAMEDSACAEVD